MHEIYTVSPCFASMHVVETDNAPDPAGAYSQAIIDDGRVYVSGQVGLDPEIGEVISDDVAEQTTQTLKNVEAVLEVADVSLYNAIKSTSMSPILTHSTKLTRPTPIISMSRTRLARSSKSVI